MTDIYPLDTRLTMYNNFPKGGVGAEIGVCKGANAVCLFVATRPTKLHLVDTWERNPATELYHPIELFYGDWRGHINRLFPQEIIDGSVVLHKTTGIDFFNSVEDNSLDWVYLDSDHNFSNIIQEIRLATKKVRSGGVISGHDFCVHEKAWRSGVMRAVITIIQEGLIRMESLTDEVFPSYFCRVL